MHQYSEFGYRTSHSYYNSSRTLCIKCWVSAFWWTWCNQNLSPNRHLGPYGEPNFNHKIVFNYKKKSLDYQDGDCNLVVTFGWMVWIFFFCFVFELILIITWTKTGNNHPCCAKLMWCLNFSWHWNKILTLSKNNYWFDLSSPKWTWWWIFYRFLSISKLRQHVKVDIDNYGYKISRYYIYWCLWG